MAGKCLQGVIPVSSNAESLGNEIRTCEMRALPRFDVLRICLQWVLTKLEDAMEGFPKYWPIHTHWPPATQEGNKSSLRATHTHTHTHTHTPIDLYIYVCVSVPLFLAACYNLLQSVTCGMARFVTLLRMNESVYRCMIQQSSLIIGVYYTKKL